MLLRPVTQETAGSDVAKSPCTQVLPSFMLEEITFGAAQRVKLVQRIMTALAKCATPIQS